MKQGRSDEADIGRFARPITDKRTVVGLAVLYKLDIVAEIGNLLTVTVDVNRSLRNAGSLALYLEIQSKTSCILRIRDNVLFEIVVVILALVAVSLPILC